MASFTVFLSLQCFLLHQCHGIDVGVVDATFIHAPGSPYRKGCSYSHHEKLHRVLVRPKHIFAAWRTQPPMTLQSNLLCLEHKKAPHEVGRSLAVHWPFEDSLSKYTSINKYFKMNEERNIDNIKKENFFPLVVKTQNISERRKPKKRFAPLIRLKLIGGLKQYSTII